jgi:hypothetical protein
MDNKQTLETFWGTLQERDLDRVAACFAEGAAFLEALFEPAHVPEAAVLASHLVEDRDRFESEAPVQRFRGRVGKGHSRVGPVDILVPQGREERRIQCCSGARARRLGMQVDARLDTGFVGAPGTEPVTVRVTDDSGVLRDEQAVASGRGELAEPLPPCVASGGSRSKVTAPART